MKTLARRSFRAASAMAVGVALVVASPGVAVAAPLPDPCALLTKAHPEQMIAKGKSVSVKLGKLAKSGSGNSAGAYCPETVGNLRVSVYVSHFFGGFGGVKVTSTTHPTGLGSGDSLIVGVGPTGGPVDFIIFHTGNLYFDVSANGASPSGLTAFARQIYKLVHSP